MPIYGISVWLISIIVICDSGRAVAGVNIATRKGGNLPILQRTWTDPDSINIWKQVHVVDVSSKYRWIEKIKCLRKVIQLHKTLLALGIQLRTLKTYNGSEFVNDELTGYSNGRFTSNKSSSLSEINGYFRKV